LPKLPENLQPLLDGDIVRYELGFAAEAGWKGMGKEGLPPWDYVETLLHGRIETIKRDLRTDKEPIIYYTSGPTFRFDIAKKKPYKGTRKENKPWHFDNLTVYLRDVLHATEVTGIEADDRLAIDHVSSNATTVLCSRDKDLKQVPGWFYSWELGLQPSWGPDLITKEGSLTFRPAEGKRPAKLTGTGLAWFYAQVLIGDSVDNIPGLPATGPVAAFEMLQGRTPAEQLAAVQEAYMAVYGAKVDWNDDRTIRRHPDGSPIITDWVTELLEQGRLCWLTRRLHEYNPISDPQEYAQLHGTPVLWEIGMEE
jgi:hypothetical protein